MVVKDISPTDRKVYGGPYGNLYPVWKREFYLPM